MAGLEIQMEQRGCKGCGIAMTVSANSKQLFHSKHCEFINSEKEVDLSWRGQRRAFSVEKSTTENATKNGTTTTLRSPSEKDRSAAIITARTKRNTWKNEKETMDSFESKETSNAKSGTKNIVSTRELQQTKSDFEGSSTEAEKPENSPSQFSTQSEILNQEAFQSMSLLTDVATELHDLMKGLRSQQPDLKDRLYDADRVRTAAECGKQIISTMRMKLDIMKFAKEVYDDYRKQHPKNNGE
jgi:hypothetical protein